MLLEPTLPVVQRRMIGHLTRIALLGLLAPAMIWGAAGGANYTVAIHPTAEKGPVSPELLGFNSIYGSEPDAQWGDGGKLAKLVRDLQPGIIRYPGGTVVTFYHWTNPTVPGHVDSWAPNYNPARNKPPSATLSLDEYLDFVGANHITPLVGINMGSGMKYQRVAEGIDEAKAVVRHCLERKAHVVYYYLDNEPYQRDANFTYTPEQYADQINRYAPAMKAVDPNVRIIANLHPGVTHMDYTRTVVRLAGANIDVVDIHNYWDWGHACFADWIAEPQMLHQHKWSYADQRSVYRKIFAEEGYPKIELAVLEWNIGPSGPNPVPTQAEAALMAAEQFMQFVQSGLKLSCLWPLHMENGDSSRAIISSARGYVPNKMYGMLRQFTGIGGQMQVENTVQTQADPRRLVNVTLRSSDGRTLWIFLLNKNQDRPETLVDLDLSGFAGFTGESAVGFVSTENSAGPLVVQALPLAKAGEHLEVRMPRNSFAKIIVSRPGSAKP
jgi:alpha-L-arabinofuranosidase